MGEAKAKAKAAEAETKGDGMTEEEAKLRTALQGDKSAAVRAIGARVGQLMGDKRLSQLVEERLSEALKAPPRSPEPPSIAETFKAMMELEARAIQIAQQLTGTNDLEIVLPRAALISKHLRLQMGLPPTSGVTM